MTVVNICVVTDSNRPRHSLDDNFDDDRPLNLEPQHGAHEDPVDAEFEDAEYSDYDADGYDGYESYDDGYAEYEDYDGDDGEHGAYAEYDDEYGDEYGEYEDYDDDSAAAAQRHHEAGRRRIGGAAVAGAAGAGAAGAAGAGSAGAAASGTGAGAAAGEPGGQVGAEARSGQGLPLRGLAMVLIAVAIALIAWGAVSFVNGGDSEDGAVQAGQGGEDTSNLSPAEQARLAKEQENAERQAARDKAANDAKAEEAKKAEAEKRAAEEAENAENAENQGVLSDKDREATHVTVLNNSPIEGLAGRTADGLRGEKWDAKTIGNLPDSAYVFRESVVLYPAGDAKAKAAAEQIAKDHGLETRERNREIDDSLRDVQLLDGPAPGAVIVVTVNDMSR